MQKAYLEPTPDQTFEVVGEGPCNFEKVLALSRMKAAGIDKVVEEYQRQVNEYLGK